MVVKAVVDTNVIVSGLLCKGNPRRIWKALRDEKFTLVLSPLMFEEIAMVLSRPKFHNLISDEERKEVTIFLESSAEFIIPKKSISICRDPEDNQILACALEGGANFIITGDKDLLSLNPFKNISIISPKDFINYLGKK
ncbi:MAG: putative toxin-antitoxin system toxin component, PIN family [Candidatus Omnitrophica bacterium]|nr:putative toxin-antitoxin system toxin component, PIN family [Candidatus Omnitrophota bacterium]